MRARGLVAEVSILAIPNGLSVEGGPLESTGLSGGRAGTDRLRGLGLEQRFGERLDCIVCVLVLSAGDGRPGEISLTYESGILMKTAIEKALAS